MKKAKELLSIFLSMCMLLSITSGLNISAYANELAESGCCGNNVFYTFDSTTGELVISGKGQMFERYDDKESQMFENNDEIKSVIINEGITSMLSFYGCKNLVSVKLPETLELLGTTTFENCISLKTINIPNSIKEIDHSAFKNCASLEEIDISKNVSYIHREAFYGCSNLKNIHISQSLKNIEENAFYGCEIKNVYISRLESWLNINYERQTSLINPENIYLNGKLLTDVVIPEGIEKINSYAFYNYKHLESLVLSNSVSVIDECAFEYCINLKSVEFGDGLEEICNSAFYDCENLEKINFGSSLSKIGYFVFGSCDNLNIVNIPSVDDWLNIAFSNEYANPMYYSKRLYVNNKILIDLVVPDNYDEISGYAFVNCSDLSSVSIADSVETIGSDAFSNCVNLKKLNIPASTKTNISFKNDTNIESITITAGTGTMIDYTDKDAFHAESYRNTPWYVSKGNLKSIVIEEGVENIGKYAFCNNDGIESIILPSSLKSISWSAFEDCVNLKKVNISDISSWCSVLFRDNPLKYANNLYLNDELVENLVIPNGVTNISDYAFEGCENLTAVTIPDSVISIGSGAFYNCFGLKKVNISSLEAWCKISFGNNPLNYANNIYLNDELITDLVIPNGVTEITSNAFYNCASLTSVTIPNSVTSIGEYAFYDCNKIQSVDVPDSVKYIGYNAFYGIKNINCSLQYDEKNKNWGAGHYNSYENGILYTDSSKTIVLKADDAENIVIPNGVTEIASGAFENCKSLQNVTIPDSVISIGSYAFSGCVNISTITVPSSVKTIGWDAFEGIHIVIYDGTATGAPWGALRQNVYFDGDFYYSDSEKTSIVECVSNDNSIIIPTGVTNIGSFAFKNCKNLQNITIPDSIISIGSYAFSGCANISTITVPSSVKTIGLDAFEGVHIVIYDGTATGAPWGALRQNVYFDGDFYYSDSKKTSIVECVSNDTSITIPARVVNIDSDAFVNCKNISKVYLSNLIAWSNADLSLYLSYNLYLNNKLVNDLVIPSGVKKIGLAFSKCNSIKSITIPSSIAAIERNAFCDCENVSKVYLSDLATWSKSDICVYSSYDLYLNNNLVKELVIPSGIKIIGSAFSNCTSITGLTIPEGVVSIHDFKNCSNLKHISVPNSLRTALGSFYGCSSLNRIDIKDLKSWCNIDFHNDYYNPLYFAHNLYLNDQKIDDLVIPNGIEQIKSFTFQGININTLKIPDSVVFIGGSSFARINNITSVVIPKNAVGIDIYAFYMCKNLKTVYLPTDIYGAEEGAFDRCGITDVYYHGTQEQYKQVIYGAGNQCMVNNVHYNSHLFNSSSVTKATLSKNGKISSKCYYCDNIKSTIIYYPKTITLGATKYTYDGKVKKPTVKVVDANGKTIAATNYTVTYSSGLKNVGKYTVKIAFKGNYSGTVSKTFTIVPKTTSISSLTAAAKGFTVKWKKQATQTTGYQIQIATDSKFTKGVKSYTVSKNSTVSKKITKLTGKKMYYVRIRTYKTVSGTKYYSFWSGSKTVTTKK